MFVEPVPPGAGRACPLRWRGCWCCIAGPTRLAEPGGGGGGQVRWAVLCGGWARLNCGCGRLATLPVDRTRIDGGIANSIECPIDGG